MGGTLQHGYLLLMHVLVPIPSDDYDVLEQSNILINNFPLLTTGSKKLEEKLSKFHFYGTTKLRRKLYKTKKIIL